MSAWQPILLSLLSAAFGLISWRNLRGILALRRMPVAEPQAPRHWEKDDYWPMVSVIVPADAPAGRIEACIESLRSQDYPRYEILLAAPSRHLADWTWLERPEPENGRLQLIACHRESNVPGSGAAHRAGAVDHARGSWLLFATGNTTFHPSCLTSLVREALQRRTDLVGAIPAITVRHPQGIGLLTVAAGVMCSHASAVTSRESEIGFPEVAFLAGDPLLLVRRIAYDEVGGFDRAESVARQTFQLARSFRNAGLRILAVRAARIVSVAVDGPDEVLVDRLGEACITMASGSRIRWFRISAGLLATSLFPLLAIGVAFVLLTSRFAVPLGGLVAIALVLALTTQAAQELVIARGILLPWSWVLSRATAFATALGVASRSFPRRSKIETLLQPQITERRLDSAETLQ